MLYRQHLISELHARREAFVSFERTWGAEVRAYARRLRALAGQSAQAIKETTQAQQQARAAHRPNALPAAELERTGAPCVAFNVHWRSHEEARGWALEVLAHRVTCAADGSQLLPGREISLPVAAVQVASFENPHTADGRGYRKEAHFELVTPDELLATDGGRVTAADIVGLRRFALELRVLGEFMERKRGWRERGERAPLALFDGTLLISAAQIRTESNFPTKYIEAVAKAIRLSRETQVPLVGFVDQSYARDIVSLLDALAGDARRAALIYDAQVLRARADETDAPLLAAWGDRTVFCYCQREGLTDEFFDEQREPLVGFLYLQTTGEGTPARLDVPAWVYEAGLLEEVLDTVRAECVVGNGYPYALETADEAAYISGRDRAQFMRALQEFAEREQMPFRVARKAISKAHRR
jgi:NurA domain